MKERWKVIHVSIPPFNGGEYESDSYPAAVDLMWKLYREAREHGCTRVCFQRLKKYVNGEWVEVDDLIKELVGEHGGWPGP